MINWEALLPKKVKYEGLFNYSQYDEIRDKAIYDCITTLKAAEQNGEICKPLSVEEIEVELLRVPCWNVRKNAEAIHRAMTNKEGVCDR